MRILVVEDDLSIATLLIDLLAGEGHTATHAATPEATRKLHQQEAWDRYLVDLFSQSYDKPSPEDMALLKELSSKAPVIVVTARSWAAQTRPEELGVAAIIRKPYDVEELLAAVQAAGGSD
jgi:DNA-binding response OmpR family regulator